jgi:hypothetical protein
LRAASQSHDAEFNKQISDIFVRGSIKASLGNSSENGGTGERFEAAFDGSVFFWFFFTSFVPDSRASERAERMDGRENPD